MKEKCILSTIQVEEKPEEKPELEVPPEEPQPPEPAPEEGEGDEDELDDGSEERQSPESPEFIIIEDVSTQCMLISLGHQIPGNLRHPKSCIRHIWDSEGASFSKSLTLFCEGLQPPLFPNVIHCFYVTFASVWKSFCWCILCLTWSNLLKLNWLFLIHFCREVTRLFKNEGSVRASNFFRGADWGSILQLFFMGEHKGAVFELSFYACIPNLQLPISVWVD